MKVETLFSSPLCPHSFPRLTQALHKYLLNVYGKPFKYVIKGVGSRIQKEGKTISERGVCPIRDLGLFGGRERDTGAEEPAQAKPEESNSCGGGLDHPHTGCGE